MQYDIGHPPVLTEMKSRIIFQNGLQAEDAIISNLTEEIFEMLEKHTPDIIKHHIFL